MKLQQLRYVLEIARHDNNLSAAAQALNTSQPGVSRQIQMLEEELGFAIFQRTRNRIIGLTDNGERVLEVAKRVVNDVASLRSMKEELDSSGRGTLAIGTTHTQARYVLPRVIEPFVKAYPGVQLIMKEGNPEDICTMVDTGEADIAIGTDTIRPLPNLVRLPCFALPRSVVARTGHPILSVEKLTLEEVAAHPIITYDPRYSGRWRVMKAFRDAGLSPKIVLSAIDADVCKTYITLGLGIGILTTITFDAERDIGLAARDASHLFESSMIYITLRKNTYLRPYILDFIGRLGPHLTPKTVRMALQEA